MVVQPHSIKHALNPAARSPAGRRLTPRIHLFDKIIELMLADASLSLKDIAAALGRSAVWVGYVVKSDAFRDLYEARRASQNAEIHKEVAESLARVARKSLGKLEEIIDKNPAKVTPQMALDISAMSLEKLGYGVKLPGQPVTNINVMSVSPEDFQRAQSIVRSIESSPRAQTTVMDAAVTPPSEPHPTIDHAHPTTAPTQAPRAVGPAPTQSPRVTPLRDILAQIDTDDPGEVSIAGDAA